MFKPELHFPFRKPPEGLDVLWRCEAKRYASFDDDGDVSYISPPRLELHWIRVDRRTPKGAWIFRERAGELQISRGKFINLARNKAYARNTVEEAVRDFAERRKRQIGILKGQLQRAEQELQLTKERPLPALPL